MVDYKEKIKKLLALSKSPNEHEAQSALAKAQQLMAEHKISMAEVEDKEQRKAYEHLAEVTYSARRDPWILRLSQVISKNYCVRRKKNSMGRTWKGNCRGSYIKRCNQISRSGLECSSNRYYF